MNESTLILKELREQAERSAQKLAMLHAEMEEEKKQLKEIVREHERKRLSLIEQCASESGLGPRLTLAWSSLGDETKLIAHEVRPAA